MAAHEYFEIAKPAPFASTLEFPMKTSDIHFFHRKASSFLQIVDGDRILRLFIAQSFSLKAGFNANGELTLFVTNQGAEKSNPLDIDFGKAGTGLLIAPNGGGIGIADIRDGAVKLNSVVFDLKRVELNCVNKGGSQVQLSFDPAGEVVFPKA